MKIVYTILCGATLLTLAYCKSTKTGQKATPPAFEVSDKQLSLAQTRWPGTTPDEIKSGQNIFVTRCTECHAAFEITKFGEKKWVHEIGEMSPKAKLTADEKLLLTKYILSYREAFTVPK